MSIEPADDAVFAVGPAELSSDDAASERLERDSHPGG